MKFQTSIPKRKIEKVSYKYPPPTVTTRITFSFNEDSPNSPWRKFSFTPQFPWRKLATSLVTVMAFAWCARTSPHLTILSRAKHVSRRGTSRASPFAQRALLMLSNGNVRTVLSSPRNRSSLLLSEEDRRVPATWSRRFVRSSRTRRWRSARRRRDVSNWCVKAGNRLIRRRRWSTVVITIFSVFSMAVWTVRFACSYWRDLSRFVHPSILIAHFSKFRYTDTYFWFFC